VAWLGKRDIPSRQTLRMQNCISAAMGGGQGLDIVICLSSVNKCAACRKQALVVESLHHFVSRDWRIRLLSFSGKDVVRWAYPPWSVRFHCRAPG